MTNMDGREELINNLCLYLQSKTNEPMLDIKNRLYMLLEPYEILPRTTEVAILKEDRNEYLLKSFLIAKKVKGCTERTLRYYAESVKKTLETIGKTVDDVTTEDIRYYMAIRMQRDKVSKTTIGNEIRNLGSFFGWLYAEEIIRRNPMAKIDRIKQEKTKKEALTELEIEQLRDATDDEREKFLIELLLFTGCRVSEVVQILLADIEGERILVHGKGQKDRYVYLNAKARLALSNYMKERSDKNPYLFPRCESVQVLKKKGMSHKDMRRWWKKQENVVDGHAVASTIEVITRKIAKRAGVEQANPHKFRRTCATLALRRGMPIEQVSKMLGHEEISTTQIYLDLTEDELALAHKKYVI